MKAPNGERYPRLLVCEGAKDWLFFHNFIDQRKLPRFHIRSAGGKDKFAQAIEAYRIEPKSNYPSIGDILIVADNDDDPESRFKSVRNQIDELYPGTSPKHPLEASTGKPRVTVLMLPSTNTHGTLECLLKDAARSSDAKAGEHCDTLLALCHAEKWGSESRRGLAWLRSNLAIRCVRPFVPLGDVFDEPAHRPLIPLAHQSLNHVADVLQRFEKKPTS